MTKQEDQIAPDNLQKEHHISNKLSPPFSGSICHSIHSPISVHSLDQIKHHKWMQAMVYLAKVKYGNLIISRINYYEFGNVMYNLGRVDLAYKYWEKAIVLANMDQKVDICLNVRDHALEDNKTKLFKELNETIFQILNSMKESIFDQQLLIDAKHMIDNPPEIINNNESFSEPYEFELRMRSISKFVKLLPSEVKRNNTFAIETVDNFDEYEQLQAQILGTLTSRNKIDLTLALTKLFNFISRLPAQFRFISNLIQIPQLESFVKELLNFYPQPSFNFQGTEIDDIIHYFDVLQKINEESDFLFFWEIYLKIELMLALKLMSDPIKPQYKASISLFEKIGSICQMLYELIKVDTGICIKLTKKEIEKRKRILKRFKDEISKFRKCVIELGVITMYYLFLTYSKMDAAVIEMDKIKLNGMMFESFLSLAELDEIICNNPKIELSLAYLYELLAVGSSKEVIPNMVNEKQKNLKPLTKMDEFFIEKMISHNLCAVAGACIDDPVVPLIFERILNGILLHGGYNVITIWATMWLLDMTYLRSDMALISLGDKAEYYFNDFTKMKVQTEPLKKIGEKLYRFFGMVTYDMIMNNDEDSCYVLPQVLVDSNNLPIVLSEYSNGIWVNRTLRINVTNSRGILRTDRDTLQGCNALSEQFLETLFTTLQIPVLPVLYGLPFCRKNLELLYKKGERYKEDLPFEEDPVVLSADFVGRI